MPFKSLAHVGGAFKLSDLIPAHATQTLDTLGAEVVPNESLAHMGETFELGDLIPTYAVQILGRVGWTRGLCRMKALPTYQAKKERE